MVEGLQKGLQESMEHNFTELFESARKAGYKDPLRWFFYLARRAKKVLKSRKDSHDLDVLQAWNARLFSAVTHVQAELQKHDGGSGVYSTSPQGLAAQLEGIRKVEIDFGKVHVLLQNMVSSLEQHDLGQYIENLASFEAEVKLLKNVEKALKDASAVMPAREIVAEEIIRIVGGKNAPRQALLLASLVAAAALCMGCASGLQGHASPAAGITDVSEQSWVQEAMRERKKQIALGGDPYGYAGGSAVIGGEVVAWAERSSLGPAKSFNDAYERARAQCIRKEIPFVSVGPALRGNPNTFLNEAEGTVYVHIPSKEGGESISEIKKKPQSASFGEQVKLVKKGETLNKRNLYTYEVRIKIKNFELARVQAEGIALQAAMKEAGKVKTNEKKGVRTEFAAGDARIIRTSGDRGFESDGSRIIQVTVSI